MKKDILYSNKAPEPIGPYSQGIFVSWEAQKMLYTSGQVAIDPATGNFISGGIREQTKQVMENLSALLNEAKSDLKNVVKTTVFLKNMNDFAAMNEVYAEYFGDSKPARSTIEVARLPKDALVEIELIAMI
ncbi:MAG TPA: RidA family protein [Ignavibacteria bacterium]|nr:RidA family protein [Ignavibacteria bacterium]HMQ97433.1 RidA family protein [Ignavibacteria bacterium]